MVNLRLLSSRSLLGLLILISSLIGVNTLSYASTPAKLNTTKQNTDKPIASTARFTNISPVSLSNKNLTPGQQLTLSFEVSYKNHVDVFLDASLYNWQPFTFISHSTNEPKWKNNQWHTIHSIDVLVPLAGQYNSPEMTLNSYLNQQHQAIIINQQVIKVNSSFSANEEAPKLTAITPFSTQADSEQTSSSYVIYAVIVSLFVIVIILALKNKQSKQVHQKSKTKLAPSPTALIEKANDTNDGTGECDWEGLRLCMLQHLDFDPLNTQINIQHLELSNRYISSRFSEGNKANFLKICQQCQQAAENKIEANDV